MSGAVLDHVGVCSAHPQVLWAAYERLGFLLTPVARQSGPRAPGLPPERLATGNRCAMLRQGYLELLGLIEPGLFDNGLSALLARYEGLHILAFGVADAAAELPRLNRAGFAIPAPVPLQRPLDDAAPDGPLARFSRLPIPEAPEGRLQLIQHHTPELLWQPRWLDHPNRAVALEEAILAMPAPAETAARLSRLTGGVLQPDPAGGYALPLRAGLLRILPPEALDSVLPGVTPPALPCIIGFTLRTDDGNRAAAHRLAGLPTRKAPGGGILVPPALAGGAALVFRA